MLRTLIEKELKSIMLSPKFVAVFTVCSILIVLSIYIGIKEYKSSIAYYEAVNTNIAQQANGITNWRMLNTTVIRHPDPMQIFVSGINNDIGRQSMISGGAIKLDNGNYSENTIFAFFKSMDLMFIVQIVLSLFAILFTYNSISGEREAGTLKLSFANQLAHNKFILAKIIGSWLGLVIPLLIPLLLGVLLILFNNIPMTTTHWFQLSLLIGISVLYFSFFICAGILLSSLTREASTSFLYLLVIWVCVVLIIPRAGVVVAGQFISVPTASEISSKLTQKNRELKDNFTEWIRSHKEEDMNSGSEDSRDQYLIEVMKMREKRSQEIAEYDAFLNESWRNRKAVREKLGFSLSRFSPASAYQLAAMNLSGTGIRLKTNYEDQLRNYSDIFTRFRAKKIRESDNKPKPLNLSEVPKFEYVSNDLNHVLHSTIVDIGILSLYILITMAGTFIAFNRYDVR